VRQQRISALQIMGLARGQEETDWIAQGIDQWILVLNPPLLRPIA
jgi:hypothetical protein